MDVVAAGQGLGVAGVEAPGKGVGAVQVVCVGGQPEGLDPEAVQAQPQAREGGDDLGDLGGVLARIGAVQRRPGGILARAWPAAARLPLRLNAWTARANASLASVWRPSASSTAPSAK